MEGRVPQANLAILNPMAKQFVVPECRLRDIAEQP